MFSCSDGSYCKNFIERLFFFPFLSFLFFWGGGNEFLSFCLQCMRKLNFCSLKMSIEFNDHKSYCLDQDLGKHQPLNSSF